MTTSDNTTTRETAPFQGISSSYGIDIRYIQSECYSVKIKAPAELCGRIGTTIESGMLKIRWQNKWSGFFKAKFRKRSAVTVYITAPVLNKIDLSTGTDFYAEHISGENKLTVNITNGSGLKAGCITADKTAFHISRFSGLEIGTLKASAIEFRNSAYSDADLQNIVTTSLVLVASGHSDTELSGKVGQLRIDAQSGSDTDIRDLLYETSEINNSIGATVYK